MKAEVSVTLAGSVKMGVDVNVSYELRQARILQQFRQSGATIEDLARAWASMDGKRDKFDAEKDVSIDDVVYGHYLGYLCEAEEILERAARYALERKLLKG